MTAGDVDQIDDVENNTRPAIVDHSKPIHTAALAGTSWPAMIEQPGVPLVLRHGDFPDAGLDVFLRCIYHVKHGVRLGRRQPRAHRPPRCGSDGSGRAVRVEPLEADVQQHETEQRVLCFGRTKSGRLLAVLYTGRLGKIRVVTAYDMTKEQQQLCFEGR